MTNTIHAESSQYGTYRIIDTFYLGRPARILYGDGNSPQSGLALDDDNELLFDYNQRFLEILMSIPTNNLLVIGGGTGTFATGAHNMFPDLIVDVVEIDKLLVELGQKYFDLPNSPRLRTFNSDGLRYLDRCQEKYELIVIDAFLGYTVPPHLLQHSAVEQYHSRLTSDGVVAINIISEYKKGKQSLAHEAVAAFSEVFPFVSVYQSDPNYIHGADQNLIVVASSKQPNLDYLQSKEVEPA